MSDGQIDRRRILVVDDSRFDREVGGNALDGLAEIVLCDTGEAALAALALGGFDLIVSDINMPGLSGLALLERVRREHPGTDFILLTGDATVESAVEALRMGATDYLVKPVHPEQLRRTADQVLARRHLRDENRSLRDVLDTVEACRALTPCLDSGEVYPVALDLLLAAVSRTRGFAVFHRLAVPHSDAGAFRGFSEDEAGLLRTALIDGKGIELSAYTRIEAITQGPVHQALEEAGIPPDALLCIPIHGQEGEAGVVWIPEGGSEFEAGELERCRIIASHATAALENAERYNHAKERAFIDDCTEIYNARYLLSTTENEIRRAERYQNPLSVLFLDLDRFKLVNDRHGHLVGSDTLRALSQLLLQSVRQVDTLARYGGDEFTILLVDTSHDAAFAVAERIRRSVEDHVFEAGRDGSLRLTVSIGVATYPQHGESRDTLLESADKAMYRAKSQGRNQIATANDL